MLPLLGFLRDSQHHASQTQLCVENLVQVRVPKRDNHRLMVHCAPRTRPENYLYNTAKSDNLYRLYQFQRAKGFSS